jgi:hypothetical protein
MDSSCDLIGIDGANVAPGWGSEESAMNNTPGQVATLLVRIVSCLLTGGVQKRLFDSIGESSLLRALHRNKRLDQRQGAVLYDLAQLSAFSPPYSEGRPHRNQRNCLR